MVVKLTESAPINQATWLVALERPSGHLRINIANTLLPAYLPSEARHPEQKPGYGCRDASHADSETVCRYNDIDFLYLVQAGDGWGLGL